ncbi:hypothetical protein [Dethiosulfatarculus sandiegensis]|uniref:Uncharacterized protein n=1 Tax=Dethiosulfatarculus sandiegensis TaxID=1429043 RepID=A0A0D2JQG8_9BACT|nr:hypothetical protein [Dethiosulfatarculus sandiegensis]KIX11740.1 hypothetical protein X474_22980 [Dethiosulfatarculus sandiegensis]
MNHSYDGFDEFINAWPKDQENIKQALLELKSHAETLEGLKGEYVCRPGVSDSLRFNPLEPREGRDRPVMVMIDTVSFEGQRFLSVCFYGEEIKDPDELGDEIPEGLFNETGYCFDLEGDEPDMTPYLKERITEAWKSSKKD